MTKKLSFLALFAAAALLGAAPALSLKNAFLPDANLAVSLNLGTLNKSFVGDYFDHDVIGQLANLMDHPINNDDPTQVMVKSLLENSTISLAAALSISDFQNDNRSPEELLPKAILCIEFPQPLGPLVDVVIAKATEEKIADLAVTPIQINELKGLKLDDEDGITIAVVFSADGKFVFWGTEENLKKQLTEEAAANAPAPLLAALRNGFAGGTVTIASLITDEIKQVAKEANPEAAAEVAELESIAFSANAKLTLIDLKISAEYNSLAKAEDNKGKLEGEFFPMVKSMAPAFTGGQEVAFVDTLKAQLVGRTLSVTMSLNQQDITAITQIAVNYMNAMGADDEDDDDEDEEEGIEVTPVDVD